jgi:hypothetical protein
MDVMSLTESKKTVERIGAARFVGSAVFHPNGVPGMGSKK